MSYNPINNSTNKEQLRLGLVELHSQSMELYCGFMNFSGFLNDYPGLPEVSEALSLITEFINKISALENKLQPAQLLVEEKK